MNYLTTVHFYLRICINNYACRSTEEEKKEKNNTRTDKKNLKDVNPKMLKPFYAHAHLIVSSIYALLALENMEMREIE